MSTPSAPQLVHNLGSFSTHSTSADAQLLQLLQHRTHNVRCYGHFSDQPQAQASHYIPSIAMSFQQFFHRLKNGQAYRHGYYWAMYDGQDADVQPEQFQQQLQDLVHYPIANKTLSDQCNIQWSTSSDNNNLSLWLGPPDHTEQLHYDGYANVHFQLRGVKTWTLFPPHAPLSPNHFLRCGHFGDSNFSTLDLKSAVETCQQSNIEPIVVVVQPGQAIYVPAGWWHQVTGSSTRDDMDWICSVNWFEPTSKVSCRRRCCQWKFLRLYVSEWMDDVYQKCFQRTIPEIDLPPPRNVFKERYQK